MVFTALYTGFSSEGRAKLRVGVLNVPWPKNSKSLEVEGNQIITKHLSAAVHQS